MGIYFIHDANEENFFRGGILRWKDIYSSIFSKAYPRKKIVTLTIDRISKTNFYKGDIVISFALLEYFKVKKISTHVRSNGGKFGLCFGDSAQYIFDIYQQFIPLIDFCIVQELGESNLYENLYGKPAFDHPVFQLTDHSIVFKKIINKKIIDRKKLFVHLGRVEKARKNRVEGIKALQESGLEYVLYGPDPDLSEFIEPTKIYSKLSNCIYGLTMGAASNSTSLSKKNIFDKYQFKGKIWDYMSCGCIPIIDYAPNLYMFGLKEGFHYLSVSSFNSHEYKRLNLINDEEKQEISNNAYNFCREKLSIENFKASFDIFENNLLKSKYSANLDLYKFKPNQLKRASFQYTILRKKFTYEIFVSGFYFIKILNYVFNKISSIGRS